MAREQGEAGGAALGKRPRPSDRRMLTRRVKLVSTGQELFHPKQVHQNNERFKRIEKRSKVRLLGAMSSSVPVGRRTRMAMPGIISESESDVECPEGTEGRRGSFVGGMGKGLDFRFALVLVPSTDPTRGRAAG